MDEIVRKILLVPLSIVGLSLGVLNSSSNLRTTSRAIVCSSLFVITHPFDSVFWPQSFTSSYVLKWSSFCNSASFAAVASLLTLFCFCTKLIFASSVISLYCTWSRFMLVFSLLISSCMLYQHLFLQVAFSALHSTVVFIHSSVFCNLYWILSFAFGVFLFCGYSVYPPYRDLQLVIPLILYGVRFLLLILLFIISVF